MEVQDDTVTITITSRLAKTGKSTIARIIAEALSSVGLSCGVEDDFAPQSGQTPNQLWMAHRERVEALGARQQSVLVRVIKGTPRIKPNLALGEHMASIGVHVTRSAIHSHDVEFYQPRNAIVCRYCSSGCSTCFGARTAAAEFTARKTGNP